MGWEDPLEKEMATHSSFLAWEVPWTEETARLQAMGSQELDTIEQLNHHHHHSTQLEIKELKKRYINKLVRRRSEPRIFGFMDQHTPEGALLRLSNPKQAQ